VIEFPFEARALKVEQPLGVYYVTVLPAELLLMVAFSDALSARYVEGAQSYVLDGTQRLPQPKRLDPIASYINRIDAAFPNAIILAANYRKEDGRMEDSQDDDLEGNLGGENVPSSGIDRRWMISESADGSHTLKIPTPEKLAAIIDGQHRLFAFAQARDERRSMDLICSVFLDLPKPYQAQLFAIINSTQKPVDKSLTYELFGYNVVEESEERWSPDKLAVFLTRRLNMEAGSPLEGRIVIAPKKDEVLQKIASGSSWKVSTAVVVAGVMRLFTTNPKSDSSRLHEEPRRTRAALVDGRHDRSPLRSAYVEGNDIAIYTLVLNYLRACQELFWANAPVDSYITKTIGVQALFDILRTKLAKPAIESRTISVQHFKSLLAGAASIDFASSDFRNLSGAGRSHLRREIELAAGL